MLLNRLTRLHSRSEGIEHLTLVMQKVRPFISPPRARRASSPCWSRWSGRFGHPRLSGKGPGVRAEYEPNDSHRLQYPLHSAEVAVNR